MELEPITHLEKSIAGTVAPVTHLEKVIEQYGGGGGGGAVSSVNGKTGAVVLTAADLDDSFKDALLDCFANVAWATEDGQQYYDALEAALYPIDHITAVYTQSDTVYDTDSLDSLKSDLVVTAFYQSGGSKIVTTYTLSGTLTVGTSTVTVSYGGKTATFDVTVETAILFDWDYTEGLDKVDFVGSPSYGIGTYELRSNGLYIAGGNIGTSTAIVPVMDEYVGPVTCKVEYADLTFDASSVIEFIVPIIDSVTTGRLRVAKFADNRNVVMDGAGNTNIGFEIPLSGISEVQYNPTSQKIFTRFGSNSYQQSVTAYTNPNPAALRAVTIQRTGNNSTIPSVIVKHITITKVADI